MRRIFDLLYLCGHVSIDLSMSTAQREANLSVARNLETRGLFSEAAQKYSLLRRASLADTLTILEATLGEGRNLVSSGKLRGGRSLLSGWLSKKGKLMSAHDRARFLAAISYAHRLMGEQRKAIKFLEAATKELKGVSPQSPGLASLKSIQHSLAGILRDQKKYTRASDIYRRLIRWRAAPPLFRARVLNNLGFIHRRLGRYGLAERLYRKALVIEKREGASHLVARTLNNLGGISRMRGNLRESRNFFRKSGTIRRSIGDVLGLSSSLMNEGVVTGALGNRSAARRLVMMSCRIREKAGAGAMLRESREELAKL